MSTIRVVIADDHTIVRDGLRALLTAVGGIDVVGEAANGADLVALVRDLLPDVAIVDVEMPGGGVEATREVSRVTPPVKVLMLTMHSDGQTLRSALAAGARGFIVKGAGREEVVQAVRAVARGEAVLGSGVAEQGLGMLLGSRRSEAVFAQLTPREHDILELIAEGRDNDEICLRFGLTLKTVRNNVANILTKLQVSDRAKAVAVARDAGLGASSTPHPSRGPT